MLKENLVDFMEQVFDSFYLSINLVILRGVVSENEGTFRSQILTVSGGVKCQTVMDIATTTTLHTNLQCGRACIRFYRSSFLLYLLLCCVCL